MVPARQTPGLVGGSRTLLEDAVLEGPQERPVQDEDDLQFHDVSDSWPEPQALGALCCFTYTNARTQPRTHARRDTKARTRINTNTHTNARPCFCLQP